MLKNYVKIITDPYFRSETNMKINEKTLFKRTLILLSALYFLTFLVYHLLIRTIGGAVCAYAFFYFHEIIEFALPVIAALSLFATYTQSGSGRMLLRALPYALATVLFRFPYHAFEYAYEGIEIGGVMLFSALNALLSALVAYLETVVLCLLIRIVTERVAYKRGYSGREALVAAPAFNLEIPINLGILSASGAMLVYKLVLEIIDTVTYFINYGSSYRIGEIAYMTFRYLFLLALALGVHFTVAVIKNKALRGKE